MTTDRILRKPEVLKMLGLGWSTIYEMIAKGDFPPALRIAPRAIGWRESEILSWLNGRPRVGGDSDELANEPEPAMKAA